MRDLVGEQRFSYPPDLASADRHLGPCHSFPADWSAMTMKKARNDDPHGQMQSKRPGDAATEEQKPAKRTRVSRACDQCRASREKCDGAQPHCQSCISQDRECTYNEAPKKRGIQPNYIRTLELLLAWSFDNSPDLLNDVCESLPYEDGPLHRLLAGKEPDAAEKLHQDWRSSIVGKQIDQVLSGAPVDALPSTDVSAPKEFSEANGSVAAPDIRSKTQMLQLPENAWTLLEFYFAYTHSWMPMTEKASMMKLMYAYPVGGIPRDQATQSEHAELWSIMAVASHQVQSHGADDSADSLRVKSIAEMLVPTGKTYEVPHLKAMILLTLIDMSEERTLDAWLRIGTVVRILSLFKLLEELDGTTRWCRHVHLAAFTLESALALRMNARGHLTPLYIESVGFINEDGRDEWDPWQDPLALNTNFSRAPARSFSTLNKLVRAYMHHVNADMKQSGTADIVPNRNMVFDLLRNASLKECRLQPAVLLERTQSASSGVSTSLVGDTNADDTSPTWSALSQSGAQQPPMDNYPYMSVPNDMSEMPPSTIGPTALDSSISTGGGDIFQELAMLERTDSSNQFMQNLGFAPDLDLQEFFGDAYQASDPMLALMQPMPQFGGPDNT